MESVVKHGKTHIQKGAYPDMVIRNAYNKTCDYLDILDKRIHIQQRALAYQSKVLAHMLQRDLYVMGNAGLIRQEAEMTHLQRNLGETACQELRNLPFSP